MSKNQNASAVAPLPMDAPATFNIPNVTLASITGSHGAPSSASNNKADGQNNKAQSAKPRHDDNDVLDQDTPEERQQRILQRRLRVDHGKSGAATAAASTGTASSAAGTEASRSDAGLESSSTEAQQQNYGLSSSLPPFSFHKNES